MILEYWQNTVTTVKKNLLRRDRLVCANTPSIHYLLEYSERATLQCAVFYHVTINPLGNNIIIQLNQMVYINMFGKIHFRAEVRFVSSKNIRLPIAGSCGTAFTSPETYTTEKPIAVVPATFTKSRRCIFSIFKTLYSPVIQYLFNTIHL